MDGRNGQTCTLCGLTLTSPVFYLHLRSCQPLDAPISLSHSHSNSLFGLDFLYAVASCVTIIVCFFWSSTSTIRVFSQVEGRLLYAMFQFHSVAFMDLPQSFFQRTACTQQSTFEGNINRRHKSLHQIRQVYLNCSPVPNKSGQTTLFLHFAHYGFPGSDDP